MITGGAAEVETFKGALSQAKKEAGANKAAADKAAAELEAEQVARRQHEAWVAEVEQELKDAISKCETLEQKTSAQSSDLAKALQDAKEVRSGSRSTHEEIHQERQIVAGKAFLLPKLIHQKKRKSYTVLNDTPRGKKSSRAK